MSLKARKVDRRGAFAGGRPEFAIIDIGSNTVRMVIYGGSPRAPVVLFNEKVAARLGREIAATENLAVEAIELAMSGLRRYALLLAELGIEKTEVVATAAVREATNGPTFVAMVEELGFTVRILSGEDEARTSAMGIAGAFPGAGGVVADLGGGSLELATLTDGQSGSEASLPLGTLRLPEHRRDTQAATVETLNAMLVDANWAAPTDGALYLVGGTWRAMAVVAMEERDYPLTDPHGFKLPLAQAWQLAQTIANADPASLTTSPRISTMRSGSLPDAGLLLLAMLERLQPESIIFSSWGLREGVIYQQLPDYERERDPLLSGVSEFAASRGCPPMLATRVAGWTVGAVPPISHGSERLRLSATMLALASMQIEPNLRIGIARDWALHKRWIAVSARDRAMMAAAVAANGNRCEIPDSLRSLATDAQLEEAICWGLAIRLCRRLGGLTNAIFNVTDLRIDGGSLALSIEKSHEAIYGLPNEKDMILLSDRLGLDPVLRIFTENEMRLLRNSEDPPAK